MKKSRRVWSTEQKLQVLQEADQIGVIRRFFPKKTDLTLITDKEVQRVEDNINNRAIRKFNYKSANQIYSMKIALIT
jgi:IS30 family transposase